MAPTLRRRPQTAIVRDVQVGEALAHPLERLVQQILHTGRLGAEGATPRVVDLDVGTVRRSRATSDSSFAVFDG
jgi:hypothetical protein